LLPPFAGAFSGAFSRNPAEFLLRMTTENQVQFKTWMCLICGWVYDEAAGLPEEGIAPGTRWEDVPMNWTCPECGARKDDFEMVEI
jgi:rubredoxin